MEDYYLDGSKGLVNYAANITAGLYNVQAKNHMANQVQENKVHAKKKNDVPTHLDKIEILGIDTQS